MNNSLLIGCNHGLNDEHINKIQRTFSSFLEKIHGSKISPTYKPFVKAGTKRRIPDISKIKKLGYSPKILIEEGLKISYDWYKNYYSKN